MCEIHICYITLSEKYDSLEDIQKEVSKLADSENIKNGDAGDRVIVQMKTLNS